MIPKEERDPKRLGDCSEKQIELLRRWQLEMSSKSGRGRSSFDLEMVLAALDGFPDSGQARKFEEAA